ncbi:hypothetical protein [Streptomyces sp. Ac-502]|uniref:hypothetical protein n=1 Tax=Streptomyces sp. Ac-502 TaxID=3342801 RepID=UPI003862C784
MPSWPQEPTVTPCWNGRPLSADVPSDVPSGVPSGVSPDVPSGAPSDASRRSDPYAVRLTEANRSALADLFASLDMLENLIGQIRDHAHDTVAGAHTCLAQSLHHVQTSLATVEALDQLARRLQPRPAPPHESGRA